MSKVVRFTTDGKVEFVYEDDHPALKLGKAQIERASDVYWDHQDECWRIHIRGEREPLPEGFEKRQDAIGHEVAYLNRKLATG